MSTFFQRRGLYSESSKCDLFHQLSFQEWTKQMRDILKARKCGNFSFRNTSFKASIKCYYQFIDVGTMISPAVYKQTEPMIGMTRHADQTHHTSTSWAIAALGHTTYGNAPGAHRSC
ncbi:hypothetical protein MKW98_012670 [Papaver atlanticum]|uniref:Serine/threonine-protein kinase BSK1-like TPR repeats domain-containing protein n=1 Tax=Papaver atlanticum TaxID=357466 RepID=A0AAD4T0C4_9MAGN|nr:hypothetical protein MKW98_012670 [Papaver atlanticum]